jgi:hypothetical protein
MTSALGPRIGDAGDELEMGIYRVEKNCKFIKLTSASLVMRTRKGMSLLMATDQVRGWTPVICIDTSSWCP